MYSPKLSGDTRGQFVTLGSILLALLIISGVYVGYIGVTSYDDRRDGVSQVGEMNRPSGELADAFSTTLSDINHDPDISTVGTRKTEVENTYQDIGEAYSQQSGVETEYIRVNVREVQTDGYRIAQTDPTANFSAYSGGSYQSDWTAFSGAVDARQFTVNIHPLSLPDGTGATPKFIIGTDSGTTELSLYLDDRLRIEENGTEVCSTGVNPNKRVSIDLLRGVVDNNPCHDYQIDSAVNEIRIENGGLVDGTFSITRQEGSRGGVVGSQSQPPTFGSADSPVETEVVYAAVVDVTTVQDGHGVTKPLYIAPGDTHVEATA